MPKHYIYRMDHDTGFAPRLIEDFCILCGCMKKNVERGATKGSWVAGVGGNGTGKPDALIYAMLVDATPTLGEFSRSYPSESRYLFGHEWGVSAESPVLVSKQFYYFGREARTLPDNLSHLVRGTPRCKLMTDEEAARLERFVVSEYKRPGKPNNPFMLDGALVAEVLGCPFSCEGSSG